MYGVGEGGEETKVHTSTFYPIFSADYTNLGMPVLCGNFFKYADRNRTKYAGEICGIMPRLHIRMKPAYRNGESICGKVCDIMYTFENYANNAEIAYSHKTGMPTQ